MTMTIDTPNFTATQTRAIELLGDGHSQVAVSRALGLSESRLSQLMDDKHFAQAVADKRFAKLSYYDDLDKKYDKLEMDALNKLEKAMPLVSITAPEKLIKIIQTLNGAKRRGHDVDPSQTINHHTIVNLTLPTAVLTRFTTSPQTNEVVEIDGKPLVTASPSKIVNTHEARRKQSALPSPNQERAVSLPTIRAGQTISASDLE